MAINYYQRNSKERSAEREKKIIPEPDKIKLFEKYVLNIKKRRAAVETGRIHFHTQFFFSFFSFLHFNSSQFNSLKLMNRNIHIEKKVYQHTCVYFFLCNTWQLCLRLEKNFLAFLFRLSFIWREVKKIFRDNLLMLFKHLELL